MLAQLLAYVHDEHVTYASTRDLVPPTASYEDTSPLLEYEPSVVTVHNSFDTQVSTEATSARHQC